MWLYPQGTRAQVLGEEYAQRTVERRRKEEVGLLWIWVRTPHGGGDTCGPSTKMVR